MLLAVTALSFLLASCSGQNKKEAIGQKVYDFPANLDKAQIKTSSFPYVGFRLNALAKDQSAQVILNDRESVKFGAEFTIRNEKRKVLYAPPFSEILFEKVLVPKNAVLHFGIAIHPDAWSKRGDGVSFEVSVLSGKTKDPKTMIFAKYIDPKNRGPDRRWLDYDVDLSDFAGQSVSFIFATDAGPGNDSRNDWAGWSDLQIALRPNQQ
ncbi:MAG: hypothetical protein ABI831_21510 [Betaproteobacteria bacterium]